MRENVCVHVRQRQFTHAHEENIGADGRAENIGADGARSRKKESHEQQQQDLMQRRQDLKRRCTMGSGEAKS